VPLFVSHRRLARDKSVPVASCRWALDSGGFTELSMYGEWRTASSAYVTAVRRYRDEVGMLDWAAPQDWMCEPFVVAKTGLSVVEHQRRTVANFLDLQWLGSDLPFVPVLQGWTLDDYRRCADLYERHGIDLAAEPTVGVGSVCRRQDTDEIGGIMREFNHLRLHGFGVKGAGIRGYGQHMHSTDSMAWSARGRRIRPCPHTNAASCANCRPFAMEWRQRILDRPRQETMF
jgi:hypothetical protein